ncbi:leucine-rich repeat and IQ domain-containing protein 1 [Labrus bergylta]|uniref:leucine-rich repeat and IQ domain-containing protein 1 n=1 Tax=Labrus bergylta TaxID=56723 RepID=UPI003314077B
MRLLHAPTETEELLTHSVSVCPNKEGEAGADIDKEGEKHSVFEERALEISLDEEESLKSSGYEAERDKLRCEEVKKEEQRRQIENDFQRELKKIMEAEKLHQRELELMEKQAQEKLEQELLLQQEVISSLQRRVKEERRRMEEEQKRLKDEEDKKRREEATIKIEAEMRRMEEERVRKEEEERQIEEMRLKEEERKNEEAEKRRMEREEERLLNLEKKKLSDEMRLMEEEERKKRVERGRIKRNEKRKIEEDRKNIEEVRKMENRKNEDEVVLENKDINKMHGENLKIGKEKQIMEEKRKLKEVRKRKEEEGEMEAERKRMGEERRRMIEEERKTEEKKLRKEEEERRNQEEERRRMEREEEEKREKEKSKMNLELEAELRIMEEEEKQKKRELERIKMEKEENERERAEEANKSQKDENEIILNNEEEERKNSAQDKNNQEKRTWGSEENGNQGAEGKAGGGKQREVEERQQTGETEMEWKEMEQKKARKEEGEKKEQRPIVETKNRKKDDERKTKPEKQWRTQGDKEDYEEEDTDRFKGYDVDQRTVENENETKDDKSKREEGEQKLETEKKNVKVEKEQMEENSTHVYKETEDGVRLREEENNLRIVEEEKEVKVVEENELQEKKEDYSTAFLYEKMNKDTPECSIISNTWTSSSPGPSHRESTISPITTESEPQQNDLDITSQTSTDKKVDDKNQVERPSSVSAFIPVFLPEHTEQKRLSWMKECVPWSQLSLQNKRKRKGSFRSVRGLRRAVEASGLPPLCQNTLLQTAGWTSLKEVTTVSLEDLPGCSLSTLSQCTQLQSLTLRRCGLKSLESINQLSKLCYIDVQENDISFVDCENMTSLRVLKLGHNKLTSIHGLTGAESLGVLELSHNSITRIAGLESLRRLQRLSLDHNQLISTKGLKDVYTLLHLSCSHNHLVRAEGLENSALLNTLDLRTNSLTEPPSINNHVLLRELHLDDNSISSLQDLSTCWLPLIQHLSVAQNRIIQLPSMSDFVSLANLDLRFNCLSELQNLCESLDGCHILQELRLTGNPLQQESCWRSTLQKALPGLRAFYDQETDSSPSPPAVQQVSLASDSFLAFCQAQLQQTHDLQKQHSRELSKASSPLDALKTSCRHFTEALQLAEDQRFAHEYGDTTVSDRHKAGGPTTPEETTDMGPISAEKHTEPTEMEATDKAPAVIPNRDNIRCSYWTLEEKSVAKIQDSSDCVTAGVKMGLNANIANSDSEHTVTTKSKSRISSDFEVAAVSNHQDLELQSKAAVLIQQMWRKYRQKCWNISSPSTAEKREGQGEGGGGEKPESGPSVITRSVNGQDYAATVIQAVWRGFTLRRRLTSALAAVTCTNTGEDDTFEEVDVDEFVFDEAALEKHWTTLYEDPPPRCYNESEQQLSLKVFPPPGTFPEASQHILPPPLVWRSKQAWVDEEQVVSAEQRISPVSSTRSKSPASTPLLNGLTERSEKILEEWGFTHSHTALLMLKRAQKMKSKKQQQKKNPSGHPTSLRNCSYQMDPVGAPNRRAKRNRNNKKVVESELGLQEAEETERVKQERAQQWLHSQAVHSDRDSESVRFLPEISTDILHGGRVQLVADLGYTEHQHHASGSWANSSVAARPCQDNGYPHRNSLGHARKEVPSPQRVSSAPSKKERMSFRDNPVQLSGGWGGGKKRDKVYK